MEIDEEMHDAEQGNFNDEFEDEFESEDEIIEAGVDGRPDEEREAEEREREYLSIPFSSYSAYAHSVRRRHGN